MNSLNDYNYFHVYRPSLNGSRYIDWCTEEHFISTYLSPAYLQNEDNNFFLCDTRDMFEYYTDYKKLYHNKEERLLVRCTIWDKNSNRWEDGVEHIIFLNGEKELDILLERSKEFKSMVIGVIIPVTKLKALDSVLEENLLIDMKANKDSLTDDYLRELKSSITYDYITKKFIVKQKEC